MLTVTFITIVDVKEYEGNADLNVFASSYQMNIAAKY